MCQLPEILQNASGLDLMLMLDKLHKMGYEKLRWFSYMAPNACALRCHITLATNICCERNIVSFDEDKVFGMSVGCFDTHADIDEMAKAFLETFPQLSKAGKGKDARYRAWYKELLRLAKKGRAPYAGVCTYIRKNISANFDEEIQSNPDAVGYLQRFSIIHPCLSLFNCYVPYSNPDVPGAIEHRKHFTRLLFNVVTNYPDRLVLCGDMNIVHGKEDCWDSKYQRKQANFTDWERKDFDKLLEIGGLVDTYRHFNYFRKGFTYFFRNDPEVRKKNQGHRIDYFLASQSLVPQIVRAEIINDITASTNNPILLDIEY